MLSERPPIKLGKQCRVSSLSLYDIRCHHSWPKCINIVADALPDGGIQASSVNVFQSPIVKIGLEGPENVKSFSISDLSNVFSHSRSESSGYGSTVFYTNLWAVPSFSSYLPIH